MKQEYIFKSRYKNVQSSLNSLEDKEYVAISNGNYTRCLLAQDQKSLLSLNFEGGPELDIGTTIEGIGKITNIKSGYIITVE